MVGKDSKPKSTVIQVIYKPSSQSTDEYMMYVNDIEFATWKEDPFEVLHSGQGKQGYLGKVSDQELISVFGTKDDNEVAKIMLEKGVAHASANLQTDRNFKNSTRGDMRMDNRGGQRTSGA
ncbi:DUF1960-domain-containing protein [Rickenella mellea]|uniref:DUF1960-domain-containing protein n=1 Tax=Rickenella mellea TaxID=50990 RepID=A0A4V3AZN7_9AGAM|nr:DUF1960-domain-containing protein [Rickenella mellea]